MLKKTLLTLILVSSVIMSSILPIAAFAADSIIDNKDSKYANGDYSLNDIVVIAIGASQWILGIVGSLALLMFIYGGLMFLISSGSSDKIGQAKKIIIAAVIGLIIVFSSYLIIKYVLSIMGLNWNGSYNPDTASLQIAKL